MLEDWRWANVPCPNEKQGRSLKPQIILQCNLSRFPEAFLKKQWFLITRHDLPRANLVRVTVLPFLSGPLGRRRWETVSLTWSWHLIRSPLISLLVKPHGLNNKSLRHICSCLDYCHWKVIIDGSTWRQQYASGLYSWFWSHVTI